MSAGRSRTVTPTEDTNFHGISCSRDRGGAPPKIRVARHLSGQQRGHLRRRRIRVDVTVRFDAVQFQVVDDADRIPLGVEQLPIQQVQPGVEQMAAMGATDLFRQSWIVANDPQYMGDNSSGGEEEHLIRVSSPHRTGRSRSTSRCPRDSGSRGHRRAPT